MTPNRLNSDVLSDRLYEENLKRYRVRRMPEFTTDELAVIFCRLLYRMSEEWRLERPQEPPTFKPFNFGCTLNV